MKRLLSLFVCIMFISAFTFAQMNTGSFFMSGNTKLDLNIGSQKDKSSSTKVQQNELSITPKGGIFLKNRIGVGGLFNLSRSVGKSDLGLYTNTLTSSEWYIGPLARYYMAYGKITPFAEIYAAYGGTKEKSEGELNNYEYTHSLLRFGAGVGANYFLLESVAIEGILQYFNETQKPTYTGATGEGTSKNGVAFNIGVVVYFGTI
jgi:hypothetical protein